jgi:hypothetical protein
MTQEVSDIFSTFHDGGIDSFKGDLKKLELKIDCTYLAEIEKKGYRFFYVILSNVNKFEFNILNGEIINEIDKIIELDFEIGSSNVEDDIAKVFCLIHLDHGKTTVGELWIQTASTELKNHNKETLQSTDLIKMSNLYWSKSKK